MSAFIRQSGALLDISKNSPMGREMAAGLAKYAREDWAALQRSGAAPKLHTVTVNRQRGKAVESVDLPGPIVYQSDWVQEAAEFAMDELIRRAPRRSGRYRRSFAIYVNDAIRELSTVKPGDVVTIVNLQPYSRKIDSGAVGFQRWRRFVERAAKATAAEFRDLIYARATYIERSDGYVLKGQHELRRSRTIKSGGRGGRRRKDLVAGQALTYPAIVIRAADAVIS